MPFDYVSNMYHSASLQAGGFKFNFSNLMANLMTTEDAMPAFAQFCSNDL